ncbi:DUF411 domain-containing protein [Xanthobacter sp. ZOL 2024]
MTTKLFATRRELMIGATQATAMLVLSRSSWPAEILPKMTVPRDPNCGCYGGWVAHVKAAGFPVEVIEAPDVAPLKTRLGVPDALISCHTAEVGSYVVEGHVPASEIKRLLLDQPSRCRHAAGSPGIEVSGKPPEVYQVVLFGPGSQHVFARYRGSQAL